MYRGHDFRTGDEDLPINMIFTGMVKNQIDFNQATGRIARFNEKGHWYISSNSELFLTNIEDLEAIDYVNSEVANWHKVSAKKQEKEVNDASKYRKERNSLRKNKGYDSARTHGRQSGNYSSMLGSGSDRNGRLRRHSGDNVKQNSFHRGSSSN